MVLERFPELAQLPVEEKWQLMAELYVELDGANATVAEDAPVVIALLNARFAEYEADPAIGSPWAEARQRLLAALK